MIPLAAVVVFFTISNRGRVSIDLWPVPFSFEIPMFAAILAAAFGGFLAGAIISFISAGHRRARNRELMRMLENSRREEALLREQIRKLEKAASQKNTAELVASPQASSRVCGHLTNYKPEMCFNLPFKGAYHSRRTVCYQ